MRYIKGLSRETRKLLRRMTHQSKYYQVRQRAHCILLSYEGYQIAKLMEIFSVSRNTIYNWLNGWDNQGLVGLYNQPGRGRKKKLNQEQQKQVKAWLKQTPKRIKLVKRKIEKTWGIEVSNDTIKRVVKCARMVWKRMKRVVAQKPDPKIYEEKIQALKELEEQERKGLIEIRWGDESGFSLTPYIPYAWQEINSTLEIPSRRSKRLNVVGFLTKDNQLEAYTFEQSINSDVVIACIDDFCQRITHKTVLVLDNASVHQNQFLWEKEQQWAEQGLEIFFLPTYSPELNIIEILWRFMKYQWLEIEAYESYATLVNSVENILINFGKEYTINFA